MIKLQFTIAIRAPKQKVWEIMLADKTYRQWTAAFHEGSYYQGSWDKGSKIEFLALDDGKLGGMTSKIVQNIPYEYISIEHLGEIIDGQEDLTSPWAGAHEDYHFDEADGITTLRVDLAGGDDDQEMAELLGQLWPKALQKLKQVVEAAV